MMRQTETIKTKQKLIAALLFTAMLMLFFVKTDRIKAADKPDKPAVTITMKDSTATITIGCTKGADGYKILVNAPGDTKFKKMAFVKEDGTAKRTYKAKNLTSGRYLFKVKPYKLSGGRKIYGKAGKTYAVTLNDCYTDYYNDRNGDEVVYNESGKWYDTDGNEVTDRISIYDVYYVDEFNVDFDNTDALQEVRNRVLENIGTWSELYWYWGPVTREEYKSLLDDGTLSKKEAYYIVLNGESRVAFKMKDIRALEKMGIVPASYSNGSWIGFDGNGLSFSRRETGVVSKVELWTSSY